MFWLSELDENFGACHQLAQGVRPITRGMRKDPNGTHRLWYQGRERYFDIFFELSEQRLTWAQFSLRGLVLTFDSKTRYLRVDQTDEMEVSANPVPASRTLSALDPHLQTRFARVVMAIVAARAEDPYFGTFARQLRAALADSYAETVHVLS